MTAEATRHRILTAALAEFAAFGVAGARVDRIAERADCNKNLIYVYFENKDALFATVLQKHLERVQQAAQFTADDLPTYGMRVFEFAMANPDVMRLLAWAGLESAGATSVRRAGYGAKVNALTNARRKSGARPRFSARFRLTATMALATAWSAANPFGALLDPDAAKHPAALRDFIVQTVGLLSTTDAKKSTAGNPLARTRARHRTTRK